HIVLDHYYSFPTLGYFSHYVQNAPDSCSTDSGGWLIEQQHVALIGECPSDCHQFLLSEGETIRKCVFEFLHAYHRQQLSGFFSEILRLLRNSRAPKNRSRYTFAGLALKACHYVLKNS